MPPSPKSPRPPLAPEPKNLLFIGSSVGYGQGANHPEKSGWARQVARVAAESGYTWIQNACIGGTGVDDWVHILSSLDDDEDVISADPFIRDPQVQDTIEKLKSARKKSQSERLTIVVSLSLANEGLFTLRGHIDDEKVLIPKVANQFVSGMGLLVKLLGVSLGAGIGGGVEKSKMRTGGSGGIAFSDTTRIVLCGPYPNGMCRGGPHWNVMCMVRDLFRGWAENVGGVRGEVEERGIGEGKVDGDGKTTPSGKKNATSKVGKHDKPVPEKQKEITQEEKTLNSEFPDWHQQTIDEKQRELARRSRLCFVDFMHSRVTDLTKGEEGGWAGGWADGRGLMCDPGHPSDKGHSTMYWVFMEQWGKVNFCYTMDDVG